MYSTCINKYCCTYKIFGRGYSSQVRVRFAPSPTGYLHLGGLRTALYNFLFAKSNNGKFLLRIEDTDQTRIVEGASNKLLEDLTWCGIEIDEGPNIGGSFGPYIQSERLPIYREQVQKLINNGTAYYCFCSNKRLELLRKEAIRMGQIPKYDNRCTYLSRDDVKKKLEKGQSFCIRFKLSRGCESYDDLIYGKISYDVTINEGDPIIMKTDGYPTYHFANVVDDNFMQISHVLRGVEWQISTTKHILMYRAFNWKPPCFGHLPLLMNPDGSKLSKRQGDIQISHYRDNGILPQALINFITNSGGGYEKDHERGLKPKIYTMGELAKQFNIRKINPSSGKLMPDRLLEFNRLEIERRLQNQDEQKFIIQEVIKMIHSNIPDSNLLQLEEDYVLSILKWSVNRINRLSDLVSKDLMFLWIIPVYDENINKDHFDIAQKLRNVLIATSGELTKDKVNILLKNISNDNNIAFTELMKFIRKVLSGLKQGPSVGEMIVILGKENTLSRIGLFLKNYSR